MSKYRIHPTKDKSWFVIQKDMGGCYAPVYLGCSVMAYKTQDEAQREMSKLESMNG